MTKSRIDCEFSGHLSEEDKLGLRSHLQDLREALGSVRREMPVPQGWGDLVDRVLPVDSMIQAAALEARIEDLELMLAESEHAPLTRGKRGAAVDCVSVGCRVTVCFDADAESETYFVVPLGASADQTATITPSSPLGRAILGHPFGSTVRYRGPDGREHEVRICGLVSVQPAFSTSLATRSPDRTAPSI